MSGVRYGLSFAIMGMAATVAACRGARPSATEMASRVTVSACPPGVAPAKPTDLPPPATLTVNMVTEPAVAAGTELNLRLDGETTRSSIRVDATQPSSFTLAKGVYIVRVALPSYVGVEGRAVLTAGCSATMTLVLRKR
jgi:hypothetical protein